MTKIRLFVVLFGLLAATAAAATNLVPNGNFSKARTDGSAPLNWRPYVLSKTGKRPPVFVESYLAKGGVSDSACIEAGRSSDRWVDTMANPGEVTYAQFYLDFANPVPIAPTKFYYFSMMVRTVDVDDGQTALTLYFIDQKKSKVGKIIHYPPSTGGAWKKYEFYFRPIKATDRGFSGQDSAGLILRLGVVNSMGTARFDNVTVNEVTAQSFNDHLPFKLLTPPSLLSVRKSAGNFSPANTYTLRRDTGGAWWFVRPDGTPFWWRGIETTHVDQISNPYLYQFLGDVWKSNGKTNDAYEYNVLKRLGRLGFNGHAIGDLAKAVPGDPFGDCYFHNLGLNPYRLDLCLLDKNGQPTKSRKPQPDPYNPSLRSWIKSRIYSTLDKLPGGGVKHPHFAGYFTDNEISVEELDRYIWSPYCTDKFIAFIKARYSNSISAVNKKWSSPYATFTMTSFENIRALKDKIIIHHLNDPLAADLNDFTDQILRDYYKLVCETIRKYEVERLGDANKDGLANVHHLILSNKYNLSGHPNRDTPSFLRAWKIIGDLQKQRPGFYYNMLAVVQYPGDSNFEGICTTGNLQLLNRAAGLTGLPVLIAEYAVHARDSRIAIGNVDPENRETIWYTRSVDTQADRAKVYDKNLRQWAASPNIVGAQWLAWSNGYQTPEGPPTLPVDINGPHYKGRNRGLVDDHNIYYTALTDQIARTHAALDSTFFKPSRLKVTYPDSAKPQLQFQTGAPFTIRWDHASLYGKMKIMLYRPGDQWLRTFTKDIDVLDRTWQWTPYGIPAGVYQIKIKSILDGGVKDFSEPFYVTPGKGQPWVKVTLPGLPMTLRHGDSVTIRWTSGNLKSKVKLALYYGDEYRYEIARSLDVAVGKFIWKVPTTVKTMANYNIRVKSETDAGVKDSSPPVTIVKAGTPIKAAADPELWGKME